MSFVRSWTPLAVLAALALIAVLAFPFIWKPILRGAAQALVINGHVEPTDIIVVELDFTGAMALEAAELVQSGVAPQVAVFGDPPDEAERELTRRGFPYEDRSAGQISQLRSLGVTDVLQIPVTDDEVEGEVQALPAWCDQHQFRSIVFVAARSDSRRTRRLLDRAMKGHPTRVMVQATRYSRFDPDRWWETREGMRTGIIMVEKLVLDIILHPMSF
jgi:hypothetical protein